MVWIAGMIFAIWVGFNFLLWVSLWVSYLGFDLKHWPEKWRNSKDFEIFKEKVFKKLEEL